MSDVSQILQRIEQGDPQASEQLLPMVYQQLRKLAARQMRLEPPGHTLQPTALVHEAFLRLVNQRMSWNHQGHFYGAAAMAMRRILVENARHRRTLKAGGDRNQVDVDLHEMGAQIRRPDLVALDEALTAMEETKPELARLVSLRFFGGLSMQEVANVLDVSLRTAERRWRYAKAWLLAEMDGDAG